MSVVEMQRTYIEADNSDERDIDDVDMIDKETHKHTHTYTLTPTHTFTYTYTRKHRRIHIHKRMHAHRIMHIIHVFSTTVYRLLSGIRSARQHSIECSISVILSSF